MLVFEERGKPEYLEKTLSENRREPSKKFRTKITVRLCLVVDKTQLILRASKVLGDDIYFFFKQMVY